MNWSELLQQQVEYSYGVADKLLDMVDDDSLSWKPSTGDNWMTTGQLLKHLSSACGAPMRGFITGDWGMPEGADPSNIPPEDMLPSADKLPAVDNVAEAKGLLVEDKELALQTIREAGEDNLQNKAAPAPWDPSDMSLGPRLLSMVDHLNQHKGQLFYYLKLQGKPVTTAQLWGM